MERPVPNAASAETADHRLAPLASTVRVRRKALHLTQTELAELAGTSMRFVHTLENAKATVRLDKVLDVLTVLGLGLHVVTEVDGAATTTDDESDSS
jgi:y4mF family transcriptional regulator